MQKFQYLLVVLLFTMAFPFAIQAQNKLDSIKSRIETTDGNEYIGIIQEKTTEKIRLKTDKLGEITILINDIKKISEINQVLSKDGTYWLDNPQATRYFWAPNGYNLKKGEGYYQNVWVFGNQAIYGFTNHFSAGIGVLPLFLFSGAATPVWLTLKYSVPVVKDKINISGGALVGTVIGAETGAVGILYGMSTFGSKDRNLSIGAGWGFAEGHIARNPTINISGIIRTGPKGYFITENYIIGTTENIVVLMSLGGRRIIRHTGLDFGLFIPLSADLDGFIAVPWLGFTIPFGSKKPVIK